MTITIIITIGSEAHSLLKGPVRSREASQSMRILFTSAYFSTRIQWAASSMCCGDSSNDEKGERVNMWEEGKITAILRFLTVCFMPAANFGVRIKSLPAVYIRSKEVVPFIVIFGIWSSFSEVLYRVLKKRSTFQRKKKVG